MDPASGGYVILDFIGDWNGDPGSGWAVAGVSNATKDHTLVRKCDVTQGNNDWVASAGTNASDSEWEVYPQNDWTYLGFHTSPCASVSGCTDPTATNYDATATVDDGSCTYPTDCAGIVNGTAVVDSCGVCHQAYIYNFITHAVTFVDNANILIPGVDYNPAQETVVFPGDMGDPYWNASCSGCTDATADNYDATATIDDGSCTYSILGCTDPAACNYNPSATSDDGSCISLIATSYLINAGNYYYSPSNININVGDTVVWFNDGGFHDVNADVNSLTGSSYNNPVSFYLPPVSGPAEIGSFVFTVPGVYNYDCSIGSHAANGMVGTITVNTQAVGCTDPIANNYDASAICDDGSCIYTILGCTDATADNYDATATVDDGSCTYPAAMANLYFSEVAEGSSNNKYFEVYNPTADTVYLSDYAYPSVSNAPSTPGVYEYWNDFDPGAYIAPGDVYVVAHPSADATILAEADETHPYLSNGDDGYGLVYGANPGSPMDPASGVMLFLTLLEIGMEIQVLDGQLQE